MPLPARACRVEASWHLNITAEAESSAVHVAVTALAHVFSVFPSEEAGAQCGCGIRQSPELDL
jgi:hypothetical protein